MDSTIPKQEGVQNTVNRSSIYYEPKPQHSKMLKIETFYCLKIEEM